MTINNIPGAVWPIIYGAIYLGLQTFVSAQWPDTPPAYVMGAMAALGVAQGLFKVLWPQPAVVAPPAGAQGAPRGMAGPGQPQESKLVRFFI